MTSDLSTRIEQERPYPPTVPLWVAAPRAGRARYQISASCRHWALESWRPCLYDMIFWVGDVDGVSSPTPSVFDHEGAPKSQSFRYITDRVAEGLRSAGQLDPAAGSDRFGSRVDLFVIFGPR